jgi:hypothetical protein
MANFLKITVTSEAPLPLILNYDAINNIRLKGKETIEILYNNIFIQLAITNTISGTDVNTTKIGLQSIFNAIQTQPGGKIVQVNFPKNIQCVGFNVVV